MKFALVRREPSEAMANAFFIEHAKAEAVFADVPDLWRAMLSASEEPTPEELDELVCAWWIAKQGILPLWWCKLGGKWATGDEPDAEACRGGDRRIMSAFIKALVVPCHS
jgi:hypothetical protein